VDLFIAGGGFDAGKAGSPPVRAPSRTSLRFTRFPAEGNSPPGGQLPF